MLDGLKRWVSGAPTGTGWDDVALWAEQRQYPFRSVPGEGFVIDGRAVNTDWRLEWGPSQRSYVSGTELRLRAELALGSSLQLVLMNRELQETMEQAMFEQAVESVQTRIDNDTPPESRWLVMFPKLPGAEMGALRENFVAVASLRSWLSAWLQGPLTTALTAMALAPTVPIVLMVSRGRLTLRAGLPSPDVTGLQPWLRLFETAIREARRVEAGKPQLAAETDPPSAWSVSGLPEDDRKP